MTPTKAKIKSISAMRWIGRVAGALLAILIIHTILILLWPLPLYSGPGPAVSGIEHRYVKANGIKLHIAEAGQPGQPLIIFLHGFPEFWYEWRDYLPHFSKQGFHAVAPDQRGYNLSDKPAAIQDYTADILTNDIVALIQALGHEKAYIVGHDWGAMVAWSLAINHPERVRKLVILNVPHPAVMDKHLSSNPRQMLRSFYVFLFQIPALPEKRLAFQNWTWLTGVMRNSAHPGTYSDEVLDHYRKAWSRPEAIHSMINWYRGFTIRTKMPTSSEKVKPPVLMIWGAQDQALGVEMARPSIEECQLGRLELFEDATHWIVHEKTDQVRVLIDDFIKEGPGK